MIRALALLYFFVHLVVMLKAPQLKWASRLVGYGIPAFFVWLIASGAEPNSNIVFTILAVLGALAILLAELIARTIRDQ